MGLDALVEERSIKPIGVSAVRKLLVAKDGRVFEELFFGVFEMDLGGAEE